MFNFFQQETGAELIWALVSFDPREFRRAWARRGHRHEKWQLRYAPSRTDAHVQQFTNTATLGDPPTPHVPPFDWRFHCGRCGRSCLRARWRRLTGLFMHNNWDSWTECRTNSPPSCYTTARFHHFSKSPLIRPSSKSFLISTFIYLFIIYFHNLQPRPLGTLWQSFDQAVD